jgi:hypothetical protein
MARVIVIICVHDRFKSIFAIQSFAMSTKGGESHFALAMECRLWRALRPFLRRLLQARFPPEDEVPGVKNVSSLTTLSRRS